MFTSLPTITEPATAPMALLFLLSGFKKLRINLETASVANLVSASIQTT